MCVRACMEIKELGRKASVAKKTKKNAKNI